MTSLHNVHVHKARGSGRGMLLSECCEWEEHNSSTLSALVIIGAKNTLIHFPVYFLSSLHLDSNKRGEREGTL